MLKCALSHPLQRRCYSGLSLIELCVCLAVIAILLSQAVPAMEQFKQGQRLDLIAQTLMTDLQQARSEAVQRGDTVHLRFSRHSQGSCYLMHTGDSGQCTCDDSGQATCAATARLIKREWIAASQRIALRSNVNSMSFQARQGTVTSTGSIDISDSAGPTIRHIVSIAGRVRTCSPNGGVTRLPVC
jgi:type IV fimbrial biogenesis protein FimT